MPPGSHLVNYTDSLYSIRVPASWKFEKGGKMGTEFFIYSKELSSQINLVIESDDTTSDLNGYMLLSDAQFKNAKGLEMISNSRETVNGRVFHKWIYTLENETNRNKFRIEQYIWFIKHKAYILTFAIPANVVDINTITIGEFIMNSFEIRK